MPALSILMKPASGLCNLDCEYCFYLDEIEKRKQKSYGFMSEETLEVVIKKSLAYAEGECTFAYQGGEPTIRGLEFYKSALSMQKKYNIKNLCVYNALQTNGYNITDEWARFFAENNFLIGVSLDGIKRTHDKCRRNKSEEGTFDEIMKNIRILDKYQVEYNILTVVNAYTAQQVSKIYNFFKKKGFRYLQFIPCLDPIGEQPGLHQYSLTPRMYGEFLMKLFDLWYEGVKYGEQPYIRQFENIGGMLMGLAPEACDQRGICGMQYVTEADGSVYPCDFYVLDEYKLGNFHKDEFEAFDKVRKKIRFVEASTDFPEDCKKCEYFYLCRGGCKRHRLYQESGKQVSFFCESYKMFFSHTMKRWEELVQGVMKQRNPDEYGR